uniref:Pco095943 n=1 Tax=Arundo donax TaxID=35708 RepID=A0A0A9GVZ0_ARUDO
MMNLVLVVPWSMAATYTSSPSLSMIPPAQRSGMRSVVEQQRVGKEDWRWRQTKRGSWELDPGARGAEFIGGHGWMNGSDWEGG